MKPLSDRQQLLEDRHVLISNDVIVSMRSLHRVGDVLGKALTCV